MPVAIPESAAEPCDTPEQREEREVHQVYERIAEHFSQTRYKVSMEVTDGKTTRLTVRLTALANRSPVPLINTSRIAGPRLWRWQWQVHPDITPSQPRISDDRARSQRGLAWVCEDVQRGRTA